MKAFLIVADAASAHPDGTFSLLRGGITRLNAARTEAINFRGAVIARVQAEAGEDGEHPFDLRLLNDHGGDVMPKLSGVIPIKQGGGAGQVVANLQIPIPGYGSYRFVLRVDNQLVAEWPLAAVERPQQSGGV